MNIFASLCVLAGLALLVCGSFVAYSEVPGLLKHCRLVSATNARASLKIFWMTWNNSIISAALGVIALLLGLRVIILPWF